MPDLVSRWEGREATLTQHGVKLHFMVEGLPEHIAFALLEADCPAAVAMVLVDLLPYRADFKVTPVVHADELVAGLKEKLP